MSPLNITQHFGFVSPLWLLLLLLVPLLYHLGKKAEKKEQSLREVLEFSSTKNQQPWIWPVIVTLLAIALSRPHCGEVTFTQQVKRTPLTFVVDVSRSMEATDGAPTRLALVQQKITDTLAFLRKKELAISVSLVVFAGQAYTYCPPTDDLQAFSQYSSSLSSEMLTEQGSSIREVAQELAKQPPSNVLIYSDGELEDSDTSFENLSLTVFGVGDDEGVILKEKGGATMRDNKGQTVVSRREQKTLQAVSEKNRGAYVPLSATSDADQEFIFRRIAAEEKAHSQQKSVAFKEIGRYFVWLILCLLGFSLLRPRVLLLLCLMTYPFTIHAEEVLSSQSRLTLEQQASKLFLEKKYKESAALYGNAAQQATNQKEQFDSLYNQGTAALFGQDSETAIKALTSALQLQPEEPQAKQNLALAQKLEQQKEQQKKEQENEKDKDQDKKDSAPKDEQQQKEKNKEGDDSNQEKGGGDPAASPTPQEKKPENDKPEASPSPDGKQSPSPKPLETNKGEKSEKEAGAEPQQPQSYLDCTKDDPECQKRMAEVQALLSQLPDYPVVLQRPPSDKEKKRRSDQRW